MASLATRDGARSNRVRRWSWQRVTDSVGLGRVRASRQPLGFSTRTGDSHEPCCRTRSFTRWTRPNHVSLCIVRRAGHARSAGQARLRDVINSWLEETSSRTALTASATAS